MAILFCGGEYEDFQITGTVDVQTTTSTYRTAYARCSVQVNSGSVAVAPFTAGNQIGVTARVQLGVITASVPFLWFSTGGSARLRLRTVATAPTTIILESYTSGGVAATLATSTLTVTNGTLYRLDVLVDYQAAGRVRVWIDGFLFIDWSGDPRVSGATTLSSVTLACAANTNVARWSEVIVTDGEDPRPLSLKTLAPNAAGDVAGWSSGGFADIDETTVAEVDLAISDTANQILAVNATGMPTGASGLSIRAVKSIAFAARGSTGPSKLALGIRQSATNGFATGQTLDTGYGAISAMWTTNPVTGAAFTSAEIEAIQLAYRSEA